MLPLQNHPLTVLLLAGARSKEHQNMAHFSLLAREMAQQMNPTEVEQCKLAAEVLLERKI